MIPAIDPVIAHMTTLMNLGSTQVLTTELTTASKLKLGAQRICCMLRNFVFFVGHKLRLINRYQPWELNKAPYDKSLVAENLNLQFEGKEQLLSERYSSQELDKVRNVLEKLQTCFAKGYRRYNSCKEEIVEFMPSHSLSGAIQTLEEAISLRSPAQRFVFLSLEEVTCGLEEVDLSGPLHRRSSSDFEDVSLETDSEPSSPDSETELLDPPCRFNASRQSPPWSYGIAGAEIEMEEL